MLSNEGQRTVGVTDPNARGIGGVVTVRAATVGSGRLRESCDD